MIPFVRNFVFALSLLVICGHLCSAEMSIRDLSGVLDRLVTDGETQDVDAVSKGFGDWLKNTRSLMHHSEQDDKPVQATKTEGEGILRITPGGELDDISAFMGKVQESMAVFRGDPELGGGKRTEILKAIDRMGATLTPLCMEIREDLVRSLYLKRSSPFWTKKDIYSDPENQKRGVIDEERKLISKYVAEVTQANVWGDTSLFYDKFCGSVRWGGPPLKKGTDAYATYEQLMPYIKAVFSDLQRGESVGYTLQWRGDWVIVVKAMNSNNPEDQFKMHWDWASFTVDPVKQEVGLLWVNVVSKKRK